MNDNESPSTLPPLFKVVASAAVPSGLAVMVGPDGVIDWFGKANAFPDAVWRDGSFLNLNKDNFLRVKTAAQKAGKEHTFQ